MTKTGHYTGYSDSDISEAIQHAVQKAGEHTHFEIIETSGSQIAGNERHYQVTIKAFLD